MRKGIIKIPLSEVWELSNKPWRFWQTLEHEVKNYPCGPVEFLNFDEETKQNVINAIKEFKAIING